MNKRLTILCCGAMMLVGCTPRLSLGFRLHQELTRYREFERLAMQDRREDDIAVAVDDSRRISVCCQQVKLEYLLPKLFEATGTAYIYDHLHLHGTVDAQFSHLSLEDALESILAPFGYRAELAQSTGGAIWHIRDAEAEIVTGGDERWVETLELQHRRAPELLKQLAQPGGKNDLIATVQLCSLSQNSVAIVGPRCQVMAVKRCLEQADISPKTIWVRILLFSDQEALSLINGIPQNNFTQGAITSLSLPSVVTPAALQQQTSAGELTLELAAAARQPSSLEMTVQALVDHSSTVLPVEIRMSMASAQKASFSAGRTGYTLTSTYRGFASPTLLPIPGNTSYTIQATELPSGDIYLAVKQDSARFLNQVYPNLIGYQFSAHATLELCLRPGQPVLMQGILVTQSNSEAANFTPGRWPIMRWLTGADIDSLSHVGGTAMIVAYLEKPSDWEHDVSAGWRLYDHWSGQYSNTGPLVN